MDDKRRRKLRGSAAQLMVSIVAARRDQGIISHM